MRLVLLLLLLTLLSPLIHAAGNVGDPCCDNNQCSTQVTCNTGLTCCYQRPVWMEGIGGTCYDPTVSTCAWCPVYNPNHPQTEVCPNTAPTCCGGCINSTQQCCHHYGSYNFFTCGADKICCGFDNGQNTCCDKTQQCINDVCVNPPTCPQGTQACGTSCYQTTQYVCADPSHSILCPVAHPSLCGQACYSDTQYTCLNGVLQPKGANPTTGPTTTGPTTTAPTSSTPAPGCVMPGDLACGTRCYNPTGYVCADPGSSFLCPIAYPSKCGGACYSPTQYSCSNGNLVPVTTGTTGPTPAPGCVMPGDLACGTRCYNPNGYVCADPGSSFLCPIAFPSKCGTACYSSTQYKCVNGQLQPV
jgi:hypothetical protein